MRVPLRGGAPEGIVRLTGAKILAPIRHAPLDREGDVVLVAYDSSAESRAAVAAAVGLFPRRP